MNKGRTETELLIDAEIKLKGALVINSYLEESAKSIVRKIMIQTIIDGINKDIKNE